MDRNKVLGPLPPWGDKGASSVLPRIPTYLEFQAGSPVIRISIAGAVLMDGILENMPTEQIKMLIEYIQRKYDERKRDHL